MYKKVAVILVNYKDYANRFLNECRDSLRAQTYPREFLKVYIVDNASTEGSRTYLKENYPEAIVVPRPDGLPAGAGNYAAANNAGLKKGSEDGAELFVIANMDVKFDDRWLEELADAAESDQKIGIAQSKILLYPKSAEEWKNPKINSLGNIIHYLGFGFTSFYGEPDKKIDGRPEIKGYASGCSFMIKKEVLEKIGGYNEEFYMYHDDIEMSWKIKLAGYKIVLAPKSVVYHKYDFDRSVKMLYYMERNRYLAIFSFYKLSTLMLIFPALALMDLGVLFYAAIGGWLKIKLKVYAYFLNPFSWQKILKTRKNFKRLRRVKELEIIKNFSGRLDFKEINGVVLSLANPAFDIYWRVARRLIFW